MKKNQKTEMALPLFLKEPIENHCKELNVSIDEYLTLAMIWFLYCDPNHPNDFMPEVDEIGDPNIITLQEARTAFFERVKSTPAH